MMTVWAIPGTAQDTTLSGQVLRVIGPNEVVVQGPGGVQYQVRLRGTFPGPSDHPATSTAQEYLNENLVGRRVTVTGAEGGSSNLEGTLWYGSEDINRNALNDGLLRFDPSTVEGTDIEVYSKTEQGARDAQRGIWDPVEEEANKPIPAPASPPPGGWKFRPADRKR